MQAVGAIMVIWWATINGAPVNIDMPSMEACAEARRSVVAQPGPHKFAGFAIVLCVPVFK